MMPVKLPLDVKDPDLIDRFFEKILPEIIDSVDEDMEADWGNMTVHHMIEHLILAFKVSTGKLEVECYTPEEKRGKLQTFLNLNRPMPKGFVNPVTDTGLLDLRYPNLNKAKAKLKEEIQDFLGYYKNSPDASQMNPVFGELNGDQWKKFHFKHCYHHLSQFGLIVSND